jgi:hypothetical protein
VNPYAKIGIKIGIVVLICIILLVAYNSLGHKAFVVRAAAIRTDLATQEGIKTQLDSLLAYKDDLPNIRYVQLKDIETVRTFLPPADEFALTGYLRQIHGMLAENHLDTSGIVIGAERPPVAGTSFDETFASDVTALAGSLDKITAALDMFRANKSQMKNLLISFQFYQGLASGTENFAAIVSGIQRHSFSLTARGSYDDIKKFTFDVFNMRPHTALVNFQMAPQGPGMGPTRMYQATFLLMTYSDNNPPPPLWIAYHSRGEQAPAETTEEGAGTPTGEQPSGEQAQPPAPQAGEPIPPADAPVPAAPPEGGDGSVAGATVGGKPEGGESTN